MNTVPVLFLLAVVSAGMLTGSCLSLPPLKWKILSYFGTKHIAVGENGEVQGVASESDASVFYIISHGEGLYAVRTTQMPALFLNFEPHTGKLQASLNPDDSLKNFIFNLKQLTPMKVHLLLNASLELTCPSSAIDQGSAAGVPSKESLVGDQNGTDVCAMVKECGIAFDAEGSPIMCQDQPSKHLQADKSKDLGLLVQWF